MTAPTLLCGCDKEGKDGDGEGAADDKLSSAVEGAVDEALEKEGGDVAKFSKDMRKKGCEILTPGLVSKTYGVPEEELKQIKVMGCVYAWNSEDEEVRASLTLLRAHKDEATAKQFFRNATKNQTKKEVEKTLDTVGERAKEREEIDTKVKKDTTDKVIDVAKMMTNEKGIRYESVKGVGDEARVNMDDGGLWVRAHNLTFTVSAYKGKRQPKPEFKSLNTKDIIAASKKAGAEWKGKTYEARKKHAVELAKIILGKL